MNSFVISLVDRSNRPLRIDTFDSWGVTLNEEFDCWPRNVTLSIEPANKATKVRLNQVSAKFGWNPSEIRLVPFVNEGLGFRGMTDSSFPAGFYYARVRIDDLRTYGGKKLLQINDNDQVRLPFVVDQDPRQVVLDRSPSKFPKEMARLFLDSRSNIEGGDLSQFIKAETKRGRRKACIMNILAVLQALSNSAFPLIHKIRFIFFADVDRVYVNADPTIFQELITQFRVDPVVERSHYRLQRILQQKLPNAQFSKPVSFRQIANPSLQVVFWGVISNDEKYAFLDLDIDWGSPQTDVYGLFTHIGEIIIPGKTDHFKLRQKLASSPSVSKLLLYSVA